MNSNFLSIRKQPPGALPLLAIALLLCCTLSVAPAPTGPQIAEKALAATVYLEMQDSRGKPLGFGSGFFVQPNLIATNFHVIEGAAKGTAKLVGKDATYTIEGVTATDKANDLVILQVAAFGVHPLPLGDSDAVKIGETVYVAGNPKGLEGTFSDGIISRRTADAPERLQMTAPISPGSSGGPVLNSAGEVIGVSFSVYGAVDAQNLNFAIPSNVLKALLARSKPATPLVQGNSAISAETYYTRGNLKSRLGQLVAAIADYDSAIRINPDFAEAYYFRGLAKDSLGEHVSAIADYDSAIRIKPDDAEAYYLRGVAKFHLGEHVSAIADYDNAIRINPDFVEAYHFRGNAKHRLGEHVSAIADYDSAIRLEPEDAYTYSFRGNAKRSLGQYVSAIADYDIAIRIKPDYAYAYYFRGYAKRKLGEHVSAIADYDNAIRIKPDYAYAYTARGHAKRNLGQYFAAITDYDSAIRINPEDAIAYRSRGDAKKSLGQYFAAIADYDSAIRINPEYAEAYYVRGHAKGLLNRTREAKQDLRTALKLAEQAGNERLKAAIEEALLSLN